jgi:FixJ family two-component response regulator
MTVPVVFVVDDDTAILKALARLIVANGLEAQTFASPAAFLEAHDPQVPGCAVLDVAMPGLNGLELQEALTDRDVMRPVVFITGRGDIPTSVRAMKAGAVDFLTKPVEERALLCAVDVAIRNDAEARAHRAAMDTMRRCCAMLTARELQVFAHVVAGQLNKQIAGHLGIAEKTIKVHRAHVMEKMQARSLADLVRMAERLELDLPSGR